MWKRHDKVSVDVFQNKSIICEETRSLFSKASGLKICNYLSTSLHMYRCVFIRSETGSTGLFWMLLWLIKEKLDTLPHDVTRLKSITYKRKDYDKILEIFCTKVMLCKYIDYTTIWFTKVSIFSNSQFYQKICLIKSELVVIYVLKK